MSKPVDARIKQELRIAVLRVIPLMLTAGLLVFALRYAIQDYLGVLIPNLAYLGLLTVLFVMIHRRYRLRK